MLLNSQIVKSLLFRIFLCGHWLAELQVCLTFDLILSIRWNLSNEEAVGNSMVARYCWRSRSSKRFHRGRLETLLEKLNYSVQGH